MKSGVTGLAIWKLDWIAGLSKETCPDGVPEDPEAVRALLNRIVADVRAANRDTGIRFRREGRLHGETLPCAQSALRFAVAISPSSSPAVRAYPVPFLRAGW